MKKYLQKLGQNSYKASLEKVNTNTKNKVLLKFSYLIKKGYLNMSELKIPSMLQNRVK